MKLAVAASSLILLLAACTPRPPEGVRSPGGGGPEAPVAPEARDARIQVPKSAELAGAKLSEVADGPWVVRRTEGAAASGEPAIAGREGGLGFGKGALGSARPSAAPGVPAGTPSVEADAAAPDSLAAGEAPPPPPFVPLRAGLTDDNAEFEKFLEFLASWSDRKDVAHGIQHLDVRDRKWIRVANREGKPIPAARVVVVDERADEILSLARTYGDGRAPYYPHVRAREAPARTVEISYEEKPSLIVQASFGQARATSRWDGSGEELEVTLDVPKPVEDPIALDVLFLIDTTGSMGDEIDRIQASLLEVTRRLRSIEREFELRYAAVLYRDLGDEYVTKAHPFTADIEAFDRALRGIEAGGGGDMPESLNQGLAEAVGRAEWREGAARVIFLIADAPPHMDYAGDVPYGESLKAAVDRGIRIHAVAASGLDPRGTFVFRQIAQFARGKFIFIEYGSAAATAASHGVAGEARSNNLDDIIYERIRDEVAGWGRP